MSGNRGAVGSAAVRGKEVEGDGVLLWMAPSVLVAIHDVSRLMGGAAVSASAAKDIDHEI